MRRVCVWILLLTAAAHAQDKASPAAASTGGIARVGTSSTHFVEVVVELSLRPLGEAPVPRDAGLTQGGYQLRSTAYGRRRLYPLTGRAPTRAPLHVGVRWINHSEEAAWEELHAGAPMKTTIKLGGQTRLGALGRLAPTPAIEVGRAAGSLVVRVTGKEHRLSRGAKPVSVSGKAAVPRAKVLQAVRDQFRGLGEIAKEVGRRADRSLPKGATIGVYYRISVLDLGTIEVADVDALHALHVARKALRVGPYELVEDACERVLEVFPRHSEAIRMRRVAGDLLDRGIEPGKIEGRVRPAGRGVATLSRAGDPKGQAFAVETVAKGRFTFNVPQGTYHLVVAIPGFAEVEQQLSVKRTTPVEIRVEPR